MRGSGKRVAVCAGILGLLVTVGACLSWQQLRFWYLFEALELNDQGYPEYRHLETGIVFVSLPGGKFLMGAQKGDPYAKDDEGPVHEVTLSPFMITKYEVTQDVWERCMGTNPSRPKSADLPVEQVSWVDCQEFCRKAGLKLPTEAQWEYACRAGAQGRYGGTGKLTDMGWFDMNSAKSTHVVGGRAPNDFGLHDMHGSVWEWCEDVYNESFYSTPKAAGPDPVCKSGSEDRVMRGGSFLDHGEFARCAFRTGRPPGYSDHKTGFRVVASPPP